MTAMQTDTKKINLDIGISDGDYHLISTSVDCQEIKSPSISELILQVISASENSVN